MKSSGIVTLALFGVLAITASARADVTLNSLRIGAVNTEALAKFYQAAFGMQEVNRLQAGGGPEIFLNFGATADAAKANPGLRLVIMHRDSDDLKDSVPHIIFNVTDMTATVAALKAAGGSMAGDARPFGNTGMVIGIAIDPVGNRIELIQPGKK
jgi:predicted enzyme related to lactoylglutathione lyase